VQGLDVLPVLLEQGNEEVDAQHDVSENLVVVHLDMANSNTQAQNLLKLELDGRAHLSQLVREVLGVRDGGRELSSLGETGTKETRDLLDESFGGKESIILLSELLDELLVLVELLQIVNRHVLKVDLLGTIDVSSISENANGHARAGNVREFDGSRETLISLGVVVFEANLELDSLYKVAAFLAIGISQELFNRAPHA